MSNDDLAEKYRDRYESVLTPISEKLQKYLERILGDTPHIDRVAVRAKALTSFVRKAATTVDDSRKYDDPLNEIQDQIGARIVTFYQADIEGVVKLIEDYFGSIEKDRREPESHAEFGYEGVHYVLFLPTDVVPPQLSPEVIPKFFELQIKTLFQHAWSEASHDILYKSEGELNRDQKRLGAFTAAQAWGADKVFGELMLQLGLGTSSKN